MESNDKREKWFDSITPPQSNGSSTCANYIDHIIGDGADFTARQFMFSNKRNNQKQPKQNSNSNCNNKYKTNWSANTKSSLNKTKVPTVDLDDESLIAARKQKFPKIGQASSSNVEQSQKQIIPPVKSCPVKSAKGCSAPTRRKTLFEKLIEMDGEPSL